MANPMVEFPHECLTLLKDGYAESYDSNIKVSEFESGITTRRVRSCYATRVITVKYLACNKEALEKIVKFYKDDTFFGTKWFLWEDPCTGKKLRSRFIAGIKNNPVDNCLQTWEIGFSLEVICYGG